MQWFVNKILGKHTSNSELCMCGHVFDQPEFFSGEGYSLRENVADFYTVKKENIISNYRIKSVFLNMHLRPAMIWPCLPSPPRPAWVVSLSSQAPLVLKAFTIDLMLNYILLSIVI